MNVDNYISGYGEDAASMNNARETNAERPNNYEYRKKLTQGHRSEQQERKGRPSSNFML